MGLRIQKGCPHDPSRPSQLVKWFKKKKNHLLMLEMQEKRA